MFKNLLIIAIVAVVGYQAWGWVQTKRVPPLHDQAYLVVYGRDSCGFTQQTLKDLRAAGIPHQYQSVDDRQVANVLHTRMKQHGISTKRYDLPVVDLNNAFSIRPDNSQLVAQARKLPLQAIE
ncbi:hypothetical protein E9531_16900 [Lampropedia puyangensis]|uniref:Glutaredoxin family protein n=1 Tax=Lampropedia puyangensis TaxID=1330072 RepID=A0A4S8ERM4_9BURK|nr:hypothetical protein [Lampropedia puyangensis]THT95973.1 hypothetical protein E9531_16900 [Lampropedia puyangensis]